MAMPEIGESEPVVELWVYAGARAKAGVSDDIIDAWVEPGGKERYFAAERRAPAIGGAYRMRVLRIMDGDRGRVTRVGDPKFDGVGGDHDRAQLDLWRAMDRAARAAKALRQAEDRLKREKPDWLTEEAKAALAKCRTTDELEAVIASIRRTCYESFRKGRS